MKSASGGRRSDEEDGDEHLESRPEPPRSAAKSEPASQFDDFDEEDFDDEFDDDFEEELEDEYELAEFGELTEEDLAEDEEADVTALGDFVDEDAEPEETAAEGKKEDDEEEEEE
jgi:hypothetical protein